MKVTSRLKKAGITTIVLFSFLLTANINNIFAATTYYNSIQKQTLTKGVTYEKSSRVTDAGLLDVHVLKVDMDNPYVSLSTIKSTTDHGKKETTAQIVNDNGAIAGINGDFFGLTGTHSVPMGVEVKNGELLSINEASNVEGYGNATFFIDKANNPFIEYMRTEVHFLVEGKELLKINNVNKVFDLGIPSILTSAAMETTAEIDARIPGGTKVVCEDGKISGIFINSETVTIPPNGFVIIMNGITAGEVIPSMKMGQKVEFYLRPTIDVNTIQNAITGAGKILKAGQVANDGGTVTAGRQPRTAVGVSQDKKQIIMMVVDGRSHSIGASQNEIANIMLEYGATEAMHLDGGGSATMSVALDGAETASVVNTLSDGAQRKVINALGIFNDAPVGELKSIVVEMPDYIMNNSATKVNAYGLDEYSNRIELVPESLSYSATEGSGTFLEGHFTPATTGAIDVNVSFNGIVGTKKIYSEGVAQITSNKESIKTYSGGETELSFNAKTVNGRTVSIHKSSLVYEVVPAELGTVANGVFISTKTGTGWIKCSYGEVVTYVPVYSTLSSATITDFEARPNIKGVAYPDNYSAFVSYSNEAVVSGTSAVSFKYNLVESTETQAVYAVFEPGIAIQGTARELKLSVFGENSNHWLRGKITDANNKEYTIDFAKNINWSGWKEVSASIPIDVVYPIALERIYVASLSETEPSVHQIYVDNLVGSFETSVTPIEPPESTKFSDPLKYTMENEPQAGFDVTFMPSIYFANGKDDAKPEGYLAQRKTAMNYLFKNSSRSIYMANEDFKEEAGKSIKYNNGTYIKEVLEKTLIVGLNSKAGGFMQSDVAQWSKMKEDLFSSEATNVIIYTDLKPSSFKQQKEFELFHNMLLDLQKSGKKIFVVSDEWVINSEDIKDGIRYINVGKMYKQDGTINADFSILRFKLNGDDVKYCIDKLAK